VKSSKPEKKLWIRQMIKKSTVKYFLVSI